MALQVLSACQYHMFQHVKNVTAPHNLPASSAVRKLLETDNYLCSSRVARVVQSWEYISTYSSFANSYAFCRVQLVRYDKWVSVIV